MSNAKRDKLLKISRQHKVEAMMSVGMSASTITARIVDEDGSSPRTVRRDIVDVQKKWAAEAEGEAPFRRHQTRQFLRKVAQKALAAGKFTAAVQAANRLMELDGLKTIKVEMSGGVEHAVKIENMTSGDKRDRLNELMAKANEARAKLAAGKAVH